MSGEENKGEGAKKPVKVDEDLILELNFVPQWARKPPSQHTYFDDRGRDGGQRRGFRDARRRPQRERGRDRDRGDRRRGPRPPGERDGGGRGAPGRRRPPSRDGVQGQDRAEGQYAERDAGPARHRPPHREHFEPTPVMVSFLPKPKGLSFVVHRIHSSRRSYPLAELAGVFLSNPDYCEVKVEARRGSDRLRVYQCKKCRMAALSNEQIASHVLSAHMEEHFAREEIVGEAPAGSFVCVAKCGLSGTLLGPPAVSPHPPPEQKLKSPATAPMMAPIRIPIVSLNINCLFPPAGHASMPTAHGSPPSPAHRSSMPLRAK